MFNAPFLFSVWTRRVPMSKIGWNYLCGTIERLRRRTALFRRLRRGGLRRWPLGVSLELVPMHRWQLHQGRVRLR